MTFFDLIGDEQFRNYVSKRISDSIFDSSYNWNEKELTLYRYTKLENYAIEDIINRQVTCSPNNTFNDLFDSTIHQYGSDEECRQAALSEWEEYNTLFKNVGLPNFLNKEVFIKNAVNRHKKESRLRFRYNDNIGGYICCFSAVNDSVLMWSHYANSSQGICIEYDFSVLPSDSLIKNMIFPVGYTDSPLDLSDLIDDTMENRICKSSIDAAILCSSLTKASVWNYEKEWRIFVPKSLYSSQLRRVKWRIQIKPKKIYFGYHFLKPFFYYSQDKEKHEQEKSACKTRRKYAREIYDYLNNLNALD